MKEDKKIKRHHSCGKTQYCNDLASTSMYLGNVNQTLIGNFWETCPNDSEGHLKK